MSTSAASLAEGRAPIGPTVRDRILAAMLDCIARTGVARTTLDDVARRAGCSRATIYRSFAGGKDALIVATGQQQLTHFFSCLHETLASTETLEDKLVVAVSEAVRVVTTHPALQYLLEHEPEVVLPFVAFEGFDPLLAWSAAFATHELRDLVPTARAHQIGEWVARVVVSYGLDPDPEIDLAEPAAARAFLRMFLLPGVNNPSGATDAGPGTAPGSDRVPIPDPHDPSTRPTHPNPASIAPTFQE